MKRFISFLAIACIGALAFVSCGQSGSKEGQTKATKADTPSEIVKKSLECIQKGDFVGAMKFVKDAEETPEEELKSSAALIESLYGFLGGIKSYEIVEEQISEDGQNATVKTDFVYGNGETKKGDETKLVMTDKGWRMLM